VGFPYNDYIIIYRKYNKAKGLINRYRIKKIANAVKTKW